MTLAALKESLKDVVAIPVTPYEGKGETIAFDTFGSLLRRLVDTGVNVVTSNGNTSEFYALSGRERQDLIPASAAAVDGDAEILVGIGLDLKTATAAAELAANEGARMARGWRWCTSRCIRTSRHWAGSTTTPASRTACPSWVSCSTCATRMSPANCSANSVTPARTSSAPNTPCRM